MRGILSRHLRNAGVYIALALFLLLALLPFAIVVLASFKASTELSRGVFALPEVWRWENYVRAWSQGRFDQYFFSSVVVAGSVVLLATAFSILAGYAFGRMRFPLHGPLFGLFLLGIMVPQEAFIVPLYHTMRRLGLYDSYWALILPQVGLSVCFGAFWMRGAFAGIPQDLEDAARVDGCSSWAALWRVLLPVVRPALLTLVVLFFVWTWNDFLLALVLVTSEELRTLPLGLAFFQGRYSMDIALVSAGAVMVAVPTIAVYVLFQRQFIQGVTAGAVQG
jgi:raffinose/stachyose/melibiose transport system permease protein